MKIADFYQDESFNHLRKRMGADELGHFELFDPARQLTYAEREALDSGMLSTEGQALRILKDKTLAFKNTRVWLFYEQDYHLAYCQKVQALRHHQDRLQIGTGALSAKKIEGVCLECLSVLQYQGVDARRLRRAEFSEQIREQFSLELFKQEYPFYPIT